MKTDTLSLRLAAAASLLLASCVATGPGGDPDVYDPAVVWREPSAAGRLHGSITTTYVYSSGGHGLCGVCGYSPCRCRLSDGHVDKDRLRILGGDLDGKERPTGEHPASWYKERGYDLGKLHVHDSDGTHASFSKDKDNRRDSDRGHSRSDDRHRDSERGHSSRDDDHKKGGDFGDKVRESLKR